MQVYLISLDSAVERRSFQQQQLKRLGMPFQIQSACTPEQVTNHVQLDWHSWERELMPTEQACFISHYLVWQRIARENQAALVMEDDALLSSRTTEFLKVCDELHGIDHLSLETRLRKKFLASYINVYGFKISRLWQDRTGAAAYVLWPSGARKLLQRVSQGEVALADAFISHTYDMKSFQVEPALAIQSDITSYYQLNNPLQTHSYIQAAAQQLKQHSHKQSVSWGMKWRRINGQLQLGLRNLLLLLHAQRRHVRPDPQGFDWL